MGYDTWFNVNITSAPQDYKEAEEARKDIAKAVFGIDTKQNLSRLDEGFEAHWYDHDKDLVKISKKHPKVLIEVSGDGESSDDVWASRYRDGESETVQFEGLPDFQEILTPEEEEKVFARAKEAYNKTLEGLVQAARRRVRALKDRITEGTDRHLSLEILNRTGPELVISDSLPLSNREYVPLLVTGIQDDGETLCTEQDPVCVIDMLPQDIFNLVLTLEGYVRDIERGFLSGRWNEDEEWYELYLTAEGPGDED